MSFARSRALALYASYAAPAYGMLGRLWVVSTGPITVLVLAHYFTPIVQGYFVTFLSLAAARSVAELGLGQVIIVQVARAMHGSAGPPGVLPPIAGLVRFSAKWFAGAGCLAGLALAFVGTWVLSAGGSSSNVEWLLPWLATSACIAADIALSGLLAPLEGAGFVRPVYFCRMIRSIINSLVLWLCIFAGLQLWCISAALLASLAWTVIFLTSSNGRVVQRAFSPASAAAKVNWRRDLLPSQWRVALSSLAEFASFYTLTPFMYVAYGQVVAGRVGVTWQLAASVSAIAGAVVSARFPEFSRLAAARSVTQLDRLMVSTTAISLSLCFLGVVAVGGGVLLLDHAQFQIASRLLPLPDVVILLSGVLIWHVNLSTVSYLRAHGGDPFLPVTLGGSALMVLAELTCARWFGPRGFFWAYVLIGAFFMVPVGTYLLHRKRIQFGYPILGLIPNRSA